MNIPTPMDDWFNQFFYVMSMDYGSFESGAFKFCRLDGRSLLAKERMRNVQVYYRNHWCLTFELEYEQGKTLLPLLVRVPIVGYYQFNLDTEKNIRTFFDWVEHWAELHNHITTQLKSHFNINELDPGLWTIYPSILRHGPWTPWTPSYYVTLTNVKPQDLISACASASVSYSLNLGILGAKSHDPIATFTSVESLIQVVYPY